MSTPAVEPARPALSLDRRILLSNLASGGAWLLLLTPPWSDSFGGLGLFLIGGAYVAVASVFMAAMYARPTLPRRQELATWLAPWLLACLLWSDLLNGLAAEPGQGWVTALVGAVMLGLIIGTPCYLAWQLVALVIRHIWAWRAGESVLPREDPADDPADV